METKGNKILKNVKMKWMSMFKPLKIIMVNYHPLLVVMQVDYNYTRKKKLFCAFDM